MLDWMSFGFGFSDNIANFCDSVEDFCGRAEMPDNLEGADGGSLPLTDIKLLINEIMSARAKKLLQLIPVDTLVRLINVLDHQIQCGQGLSINGNGDVSFFKFFLDRARNLIFVPTSSFVFLCSLSLLWDHMYCLDLKLHVLEIDYVLWDRVGTSAAPN